MAKCTRGYVLPRARWRSCCVQQRRSKRMIAWGHVARPTLITALFVGGERGRRGRVVRGTEAEEVAGEETRWKE